MELPTQAVKAVILSKEKILLLQRNKVTRGEDNWDLPGGLIEGNQSPEDTLLREVKEELGLSIKIIRSFGDWRFLRKKDSKVVSVVNYLCEIENPLEIKLSNEHSGYKWIVPDEINDYPLKDKSLADSIHRGFANDT